LTFFNTYKLFLRLKHAVLLKCTADPHGGTEFAHPLKGKQIIYKRLKLRAMKKLFFLLMATMLSAGVMAQTAVQKNQKDIKKDVAKVRTERRERNRMLTHAQLRKAAQKQKEINIDRKDMNADKKELKIQGVKHPVDDAKKP
jgi:hypothetical protein